MQALDAPQASLTFIDLHGQLLRSSLEAAQRQQLVVR